MGSRTIDRLNLKELYRRNWTKYLIYTERYFESNTCIGHFVTEYEKYQLNTFILFNIHKELIGRNNLFPFDSACSTEITLLTDPHSIATLWILSLLKRISCYSSNGQLVVSKISYFDVDDDVYSGRMYKANIVNTRKANSKRFHDKNVNGYLRLRYQKEE